MKNRIFVWIVSLGLALISISCAEKPAAEEPCNFVQNSFGQRVSWARMPIQFYVDDSLSDQQYYGLERAMQVWNDYFDRPVFSLIGRTTHLPDPKFNGQGRVVPDGYNGVYIVDGSYFQNTSTKDEQARTSISYRGDMIYEADILIDATERFYYEKQEIRSSQRKINFESLLVHELGHVLGLEHIEDAAGSVMHPKLQFGEYRVDITDADYESLACEYQ